MEQVFIVTINMPEEIAAGTVRNELIEALDDSALWNAEIDVVKMYQE